MLQLGSWQYIGTHTHTQRHILIELGKWEGAITRTSQRETKRRKERNYTMSRSQQTGDYFPKGRRMMDCKWLGLTQSEFCEAFASIVCVCVCVCAGTQCRIYFLLWVAVNKRLKNFFWDFQKIWSKLCVEGWIVFLRNICWNPKPKCVYELISI